MSSSCPACGDRQSTGGFQVPEMMFATGEEFSYGQCGKCGTLRLVNAPSDISRYYPPNYCAFGPVPHRSRHELLSGMLRSELWRHMPDELVKRIGTGVSDRFPRIRRPQLPSWLIKLSRRMPILDVGCGTGALLVELHRCGFRNLLGIDPNLEKSCFLSRGLRLEKTDVSGLAGSFGLVMLNHSLEHMESPLMVLKALRNHLTPTGMVIVRLPLAGQDAWRRYREHWIQIDPPRHMFIPTKAGMEILGARAGYRCRRIFYDSTFLQFAGSELALRGLPLSRMGDEFEAAQMLRWARDAELLNKREAGDQAGFVFVR